MALLYPDCGGGWLDSHRAFVVKYAPGQDRELGCHYDNAELTINVALGKAFTGGALYFGGLFQAPGGGACGGPRDPAPRRPAAWGPAPGHRRTLEPGRLASGLCCAQPPLPHVLPHAQPGGRRGLRRRLHPRGAHHSGRVRSDLSLAGGHVGVP
uniref:2-oxoglutarate and iron dependent oxygenase domain containing 2 n=1 Tax=Rousettus aegyptiacus TaxID=9407 RepID=A0A7J8H4W5_ROUAE|nr:2-oxoglutarate and iron dependent oxygenase domain containing 2 [Rousettus aegyptiacus]